MVAERENSNCDVADKVPWVIAYCVDAFAKTFLILCGFQISSFLRTE